MKKISAVLTSLGTTGDAEPILALGVELRKHGCDVTIGLSPTFKPRVESLGLRFASIGPAFDTSAVQGVIATQMRMENPAEQGAHFVRSIAPFIGPSFESLAACCRTADILIATPYQVAAPIVSEALGIPYVSIHLAPINQTSNGALKTTTAPIINSFRKSLGLRELPDPLTADAFSRELALHAVSRLVCRPAANWPPTRRVVGFFFMSEPEWRPDPELAEFVAREKPIVVSFGSIVHQDAATVNKIVVEAIERSGRPAVIQRGWTGLEGPPRSERILTRGFLPHGWLFARAACVIHHGGAGTFAATLRAGAPSIVVPHMLDQSIWGAIAMGLQCAGAVIPFRELTAERLLRAIDHTVSSAVFRTNAANLAEQVALERGVEAAAEAITSLPRVVRQGDLAASELG